MKAAVVQPDFSLKIQSHQQQKPGRHEVLVRVAYCGICGTDLHMLKAGLFPPQCIIGHELSGHIAEVGEGVDDWQQGDPVVVMPINPCGTCEPCRRGEIQLCIEALIRGYGVGFNPGGFSQTMRVHASTLYRVPAGLDIRTAALTEPWAVAIRGVKLSQLQLGEQALVMGAGPIGLLCIYALKAVGANKIIVTEPDTFRAEKAVSAGADLVLDPRNVNPGDRIQQEFGRAPDVVFDCAGTASSIEEAAAMVRPHGQIVALGVHQGNVSFFPLFWFIKEISLKFSLAYNLSEFQAALEFLAKGAVDPDIIISAVYPLNGIEEAFKALEGPGHTKILIDCQSV